MRPPITELKTLHKYLTRQVLASLFLTLTVFTFVLLLGNVLKQILELLVNGYAQFGPILQAIGLLIPFVWVFALPMGFLTATLLVFGRFSADQELTAVRAGGISLISLITPVIILSLICCGISAWINMSLGPECRVAYKNLINTMRADFGGIQFPEGRYIRDIPGYIFYAGKNDKGKLEDVTIFRLEDKTNVTTTLSAPRGRIEPDSANKQLILHLFDARSVTSGDNASVGSFPQLTLNFDMGAPTNQTYRIKVSDMTFRQLKDELKELEQGLSLPPESSATTADLKARLQQMADQKNDLLEPIRVQMHRQIAFSFACFGFTLVGIPLGIRMHRRETNIGVAIALGLVLVYYTFIILGQSLQARSELAPHLILWLPNFLFQGVGAVLLWRANRGV